MEFPCLDLPISGLVLIVGEPHTGKSILLANIALNRMNALEQHMIVYTADRASGQFIRNRGIPAEFIRQSYKRSECKRLLALCQKRMEQHIRQHSLEIYVDDLEMFRAKWSGIDPCLQQMALSSERFGIFFLCCSSEFYSVPFAMRQVCDLIITTSAVSGHFAGVELASQREKTVRSIDSAGNLRTIAVASTDL